MSSAPRSLKLLWIALAVSLVGWGVLRLRPRWTALQTAEAELAKLELAPGATGSEVQALERELAVAKGRGGQMAALPSRQLSGLAQAAGLRVDGSRVWEPLPRKGPRSAPRSLVERLRTQAPQRLLIRWSARGEFASVVRFLDGLTDQGQAAVLELSLETPSEGRGALQIEMVLAP